MADNVTVVSAGNATLPANTKIAVRSVTYSGDSGAIVAPTGLVLFSGLDDAKTATDVSSDAPLPVVHADLITTLTSILSALQGELSASVTGAVTTTPSQTGTDYQPSRLVSGDGTFLDEIDTPQVPVVFTATTLGDATVVGMEAPVAGTHRVIYRASLHNADASAIKVGLRDGTGGTYRWGPSMLAGNGGGSLIDFGPAGLPLTEATALVINLGAASASGVSLNIVDHAERAV